MEKEDADKRGGREGGRRKRENTMTSPSNYKKNYKCTPVFERFYTGGPFAVSPDSSFLACACDNDIKIVDSLDSSVRATLEGDSGRITAIAICPDGRFLFSASHSRQIRVWNLSSFKCVRSWKVSTSLRFVRVFPLTSAFLEGFMKAFGRQFSVHLIVEGVAFRNHALIS